MFPSSPKKSPGTRPGHSFLIICSTGGKPVRDLGVKPKCAAML
jgi:hypothetical protein